jgi:hypothetical protein
MSEALVKVADPTYAGLIMHSAPAEARRRMEELQAFIKEVMIGPILHPDGSVKTHGIDFDIIPGTNKPTLLQPGAQKLCELYGLAAEFIFDEKQEDWDKPFFYYRVRTILTDRRTGAFVGMGIGSCNSREKKYAGRWVAEGEAPSWLDVKALKKREGLEWLWKSKLRDRGISSVDGLQTKERDGRDGEKYTVYGVKSVLVFVPNDDVPDLVNTFQKMGCKRSHVHAVLQVTRSAGIFAQDIEDVPPEAMGYVENRRPWERDTEIIDGEVVGERPAPERPDLAAQREKLAQQAEKLKPGGGAAKASTASTAKAAPAASTAAPAASTATPATTAPDPAADAATLARYRAAIEPTTDRVSFNGEWAKFKADPAYDRLKAQLAELYQSKVAQFSAPPPDPRIEKWQGEITRAGGDEEAVVWDRMNEEFQGEIPAVLMRSYEARWPTKPAAATSETPAAE